MKSPCLGCVYERKDKNNETCTGCGKRLDYVRSLGSMSHSVPDALMVINRKAGSMDTSEATVDIAQKSGSADISVATKPCKVCKLDLPLSQFQKAAKSADGHMGTCINCRRPRKSSDPKKRESEPKKQTAPKAPSKEPVSHLTFKTCRDCNQVKPITEFLFNNTTQDKRMHICKACFVETRTVRRPDKDYDLRLNFAKHKDLYEDLSRAAEMNFRSRENHILYILRETVCK